MTLASIGRRARGACKAKGERLSMIVCSASVDEDSAARIAGPMYYINCKSEPKLTNTSTCQGKRHTWLVIRLPLFYRIWSQCKPWYLTILSGSSPLFQWCSMVATAYSYGVLRHTRSNNPSYPCNDPFNPRYYYMPYDFKTRHLNSLPDWYHAVRPTSCSYPETVQRPSSPLQSACNII